jgi:general secretion pathway protein L
MPDDLAFVRLGVAGQNLLRSPIMAFAEEAGITDLLVGDAPIITLPTEASDAALVEAVRVPPAELAIGRWAPRGEPAFTSNAVKRMAQLAGLLIALTVAIPIVSWAKLGWSTSSLNSDSTAAAEGLLNPVPEVEAIPGALDARLAALGGDSAKVTPPLSALMLAMEPQATVTLDQIGFQEGGVLAATIGAPRAEDINAVIVPLQSRGWRVTAQARAGTDGRSLADITVRNGL